MFHPRTLLASVAAVTLLGSCSELRSHRVVSARAYEVLSLEGAEAARQKADDLMKAAEKKVEEASGAVVKQLRALKVSGRVETMSSGPEGMASNGLLNALGDKAAETQKTTELAKQNDDAINDLDGVKKALEEEGGSEAREAVEKIDAYLAAVASENRTQKIAEVNERVALEIIEALESQARYVVSAEPFYSVGALVAFDNDLDATSIPTVAYNFYPFEDQSNAVGMQFQFGGALSGGGSGGSGETDIGLAIGGGFFVPVGPTGTLSFGHMVWDEGGKGENGWYVGINIGTQSKSGDITE